MRIAVIGIGGSGKTTFARRLAVQLLRVIRGSLQAENG